MPLENKSLSFIIPSASCYFTWHCSKTIACKLNREFTKSENECPRHGKFSLTFLVLSEGIPKLQLSAWKNSRLLRETWNLPDSLALWSQSGRRGFLSQHLKKKPAFSQVAKSIAPGLMPRCWGRAALLIGHHLSGSLGHPWGSLCPLAWTPHPFSFQRSASSYCLKAPSGSEPLNLWSMHTPPQLHVSLSALQFLEIQDIKYNQTQGRNGLKSIHFQTSVLSNLLLLVFLSKNNNLSHDEMPSTHPPTSGKGKDSS